MKPATLCFVFDPGFVRSAYVRLCVDSERSVSSGLHGGCPVFGQSLPAAVLPLRKSAAVLSVLFLHRLDVHVMALRSLNPGAVLPFFQRLMPGVLFKALFPVTVAAALPRAFA